MEPQIRTLTHTVVMVFPNFFELTGFLRTKPEFFKQLDSGIWSDVKKPKTLSQHWLLMKRDDFEKIKHLLQ